jgi:arylsulfatase A-like enzyme
LPFDNGMMQGGRDENLGPWPRTEAVIRDQLAEYYGLITHMDDQIGRILTALDETGHARDTVVVFAADNGLAIGSHGLLGKQSVFEHSTRIPLVVSGPRIPAGGSSDAFAYLHDLFPTLSDVAGIAPPPALDGDSLRPLWEDRARSSRDSLFLAFMQTQRAVRDDRWKLIAYPSLGSLQLFDLRADPFETTNLVTRPEHAGEVARLQALMRRWQQQVGDTLEVPTTHREPPRVDLTGQSRTPDQWQPDWIVQKYFGSAAGDR